MLTILLFLTAADEAALYARIAAQPRPVIAFVERRATCTHFAGEEPYDAERRRFLGAQLRRFRCSTLVRDEAALRRRYAKQRDTAAVLTETADWFGFDRKQLPR